MPEQHIDPGLTIHYLDYYGANPAGVLLLHGLGATCDSWQLQTPALVDAGYRVIAPDMRGFGKSTYPGGSNNPEIIAHDMAELVRRLDLKKVHLVGISLGGTVALEFAINNPDLVETLVIANSFARLRPKKISLWIYYLVRLLLVHLIGIETQAEYVANRMFNDDILRRTFKEQVCQSDPKGYRSTMRSLAFFDVTHEAVRIQKPTLVITGDQDTVVPLENQAELSELIPGSEHSFIPGAGHAVTVEKPDEFNQMLTDFLLRNDGS
jgi:pimeloyl-ACP methyl ester carboxylesterase